MEQLDHANALGARLPARAGDGRAALPAAGRRRRPRSPVASGAGSRCASCCSRQPDLLLLDEPTNHLDAESVQWLEQHLAKYPGTVLAVTHDRYFLDNVAEWILELDRGRAYPYEGNYSTYLEKKAAAARGRGQQGRQAAASASSDELEWVRQNAKAPADQEQGAPRRATRRWPPRPRRPASSTSRRSRSRRARAWATWSSRPKGLTKGFGDRVLIDDLSFSLPRGGIVGIIGPNGVGKTTLFKTIVGLEQPDAGEVRVGETVKLSYVDQNRVRPRPDEDASGRSSPTGSTTSRSARSRCRRRAYVGAFGFKGPDQQKPTGVLSGGERNRLNLALTLKEGGNVLLLDEPTNDLDVETLRLAGERAAGVPRLRRGHLPRPVVPRPGRHAHPRLGGRRGGPGASGSGSRATSSRYEKNKVDRLGAEAARPHRVTYRKLTRD